MTRKVIWQSMGDLDFNIFNFNFNHIQLLAARCYDLDTPHTIPFSSRALYHIMLELTTTNVPTLPHLWSVVVLLVTLRC